MNPEARDANALLPPSKSLVIRAELLRSYFPELKILANSEADDVQKARAATDRILAQTYPLDAGSAGAVFRFYSFRLSRLPGRHFLGGSARLLTRSLGSLERTLLDLGSRVEKTPEGWWIEGGDWAPHRSHSPLVIDTSVSSQVASGLALNSLLLEEDFYFELSGPSVSASYFEMTLALLSQLGLEFEKISARKFRVPAGSRLRKSSYQPEVDMSCVFSLVAALILKQDVLLEGLPRESLQGDAKFVEILSRMGIPHEIRGNVTRWGHPTRVKGIEADLSSCPDLFPSLAVLCAFAEGPSKLYGAPQLRAKESDRIRAVEKLFDALAVKYRPREDGIEILEKISPPGTKSISVDPDQDHRLAMAAQILTGQGYPLAILDPGCVNKSFPNFFRLVKELSR